MTFSDYNFAPYIEEAIQHLGFHEATPIQEEVIPLIQADKSLVAQSQTGSGKSHAFLLPLFDKLEDRDRTQLVITAPSRELGEQLYKNASQISQFAPFDLRIERAFGGTDTKRQAERLTHRAPHVIVGTPGRILDLVQQQLVNLHHCQHFVVDEADMTLDMGFLETVDQIASRMPEDLHMYVFSATIPEKLHPFLRKYMAAPEWVTIANEGLISPTIRNILLPVRGRKREDLLYEALTVGQPYLALVFANTIDKVDQVYEALRQRGLSVAKIHGDMSARDRRRVMRQIQQLDFQYVVATDLAARGIDIDGVSHVINYEIPHELEFFIHRVGRTGRQGLPGTAITFYEPDQQPAVEWLEKKGIQFEVMDLKNGEWRDVSHHDQRRQRKEHHQEETDHTVKGMIAKNKRKKVKPGYKKKLDRQIKKHKSTKAREKRRQQLRAQRKANKDRNSF